MKVLYKTITASTQVYVGRCWLVGAEYQKTACAADRAMIIYDEESSSVAAPQKVSTLVITPEKQSDRIMFSKNREPELTGIYVVWDTDGVGTVYYHL